MTRLRRRRPSVNRKTRAFTLYRVSWERIDGAHSNSKRFTSYYRAARFARMLEGSVEQYGEFEHGPVIELAQGKIGPWRRCLRGGV